MVEAEDESVVFPVVLFDGERETNVGNININPSLDFKQFQRMLKEIVGISYNNLTTYFVDNVSKNQPERRKVLITGKVNFSVIVLEKNCYFLVVLKRSRRDRRRKVNSNYNRPVSFAPMVSNEYLMQWNRSRGDLIDERGLFGYNMYGYDDRFEEYVNAVANWNHVYDLSFNSRFVTREESGWSRALCKECAKAEKQGVKAGFHFCVYDDVVAGGGFRSPVGPICRPS